MSVADSIAGALTRFGRPMLLRRLSPAPGGGQVPLDVTVYGAQGDREITITNAEIAAAQWPGPPRMNDKIVVDGRTMNVQAVEAKYLGTEVLVFVCQVRG